MWCKCISCMRLNALYCRRTLKLCKFSSQVIHCNFSPEEIKKRYEWDRKKSWGTDGSAERRAGKHSRSDHIDVLADSKNAKDAECILKHLSIIVITGEHKECSSHDQVCGGDSCSPAGAASQQGSRKQSSDCTATGTNIFHQLVTL